MDEGDSRATGRVAASSDGVLGRVNRALSRSRMGGWEWDIATGRLRGCADALAILGFPPDAGPAGYAAFLRRVRHEDRQRVEDAVARVLGDGAAETLDLRIQRPDGETRHVRLCGDLERDADGAPRRMLGVLHDVTRLRQMERSAARNRDMLSGMFRISPEAILVVNGQGRIVVFSAGAEAVFGYAAHEVVGGGVEALMPDRFRAVHGGHVAGFAAGRGDSLQMAQRRPVLGLRKDGTEIPIEASLARVRSGDELLFITIVRDLSERREAEARLVEARDRAEAANTAKSVFLANMSHELRTPLNGILGVADVLARSADPRQKEMIDLISGSARALEALLGDLLDLAQIEAGRLGVRRERFDLEGVARDTAALFRAAAEAKGLRFDLTMDEAARGWAIGDEQRLRQVLNNLLSNAVKFTESGQVSLSVEAEGTGEGRRLRFTVRDTGIGFDAETAARLFNRFEQADSSITRRFGGAGLGLSICRALAGLMGGTIRAEAEPGRGACFVFEAPLPPDAPAAAPAPEAEPEAEPPAPAHRPRILLVEDHAANRRVVELILESLGVDLRSVENGALAVEEAAARPFDLILMDMQMPVMDGLEATRRIRVRERQEGAPATPICMLTANALPQYRDMAREVGADGFLTKPVSARTLMKQVAAMTGLAVADA